PPSGGELLALTATPSSRAIVSGADNQGTTLLDPSTTFMVTPSLVVLWPAPRVAPASALQTSSLHHVERVDDDERPGGGRIVGPRHLDHERVTAGGQPGRAVHRPGKIGRASCRERSW